jgi:hypothetical protein
LSITALHLDNFNRPNGPVGNDWAGQAADKSFSIVNQALRNNTSVPLFWLNGFGPDQEASVEINALTGGTASLVLKANKLHSSAAAILVTYSTSTQSIAVEVKEAGKRNRIVATYPGITLAAGDIFSARALGNGMVEVYINGQLVGTPADGGSYFATRGGHIGLWFSANNNVVDNFGGGNLPSTLVSVAGGQALHLYIDDFESFEATFHSDIGESGIIYLPSVDK